jgi:hypothetical protein
MKNTQITNEQKAVIFKDYIAQIIKFPDGFCFEYIGEGLAIIDYAIYQYNSEVKDV